MKNKYQRMSKEEKKECKKLYYKTVAGKAMNIRLTRLFLTGIIGILFSIFIIVNGKNSNSLKWSDYLIASILVISSVIFLISSFVLRGKNLNRFAIKNESFK